MSARLPSGDTSIPDRDDASANDPPDLGGFHIVVSIRQKELDGQFARLHRRLPPSVRQIAESLGSFSIEAQLSPHRIELRADPGQKKQRATLLVRFELKSLRAQDRAYDGTSLPGPWVLAYRTQLSHDVVTPEDWSAESLHLADEVKDHVREMSKWEALEIRKLYMRFTGDRIRESFERERSTLPAGMSDRDLDVLLDLMDAYYKRTSLLALQNILLLSPVVPASYKYDDLAHVFWPSSLYFSITYNSGAPPDSTLNFMAMALHQPPPPEEALRDDDDPHGKIFYEPSFQGAAANMGGVLRMSQELTIIHGFIDSLNYFARLRSGQHQRNWTYRPAPQGRWGSTFSTIERGRFREGDTYELRTVNAYSFAVDNYEGEHGPSVRFQIGGSVQRIALAGGLTTSTLMDAKLVLELTIDDGKSFSFHEDRTHSRANHPRPRVTDSEDYRRFRERNDKRIGEDGREFYTVVGPYLNMPGPERTIFSPDHWRSVATPVFLPDSQHVRLRDPSLMYFRGFNNLRTHINYVSLQAKDASAE